VGKTWYLDYLYKGRRVRKAVGRSKGIAELTLKDIEVKIAKEENLGVQEEPRVRFRDCAREYLDYSRAHKARGSSNRDALSLRWLNSAFGGQYLFSITRREVEQYMRQRIEKGRVKGATVNREISCLRHMLNKAVEWRYLRENPARGIKMFRETEGRLNYIEPDQIEALLEECPRYLKPIVITALHTGLRESEVLGLKWSNANFKARLIMVPRTKNNQPRFVPMNQILDRELRNLYARKRGEFVFCDKDGKPYGKVYRGFKAACRRAGIKNFTFHDLRHTFASHLTMVGTNMRTVQELMGHKTIKMTMRYAHLSQQHLQEAVGLLGLKLSGEMERKLGSPSRTEKEESVS